MTPAAIEVFQTLGTLAAPALEAEFGRRDLCILATRVAVEVSAYFGILAKPVPVRTMIYNAAFAQHVEDADFGDEFPRDGSHSVGIGFGFPPGKIPGWNGHLIAATDGCFGDFSISQAERLDRDIITGLALVGPYDGRARWKCVNDRGTVVEYERIDDRQYRAAPDWKDVARRRPIVRALIRQVREALPRRADAMAGR